MARAQVMQARTTGAPRARATALVAAAAAARRCRVVRVQAAAPQQQQPNGSSTTTISTKQTPPLTNGVIFRQLFDPASSTYTYVVADPATRAAALIDPVLEQAERDLEVVDGLGLTLQILLNTHCHADHITGTGKLKSLRPGARSAIAAAAGAAADIKLSDNQVVNVGGLELKCLSTPGHTDGCMSFYLPAAGMVFTGDTLLVRGCGRTDFQQGDAGRLYDSVHARLFTLPDDTLVYPAHDYKGRAGSSVGEEKALNARLTKPKAEFVGIMANLNLPYPKQIDRAVPANLKCGVDFPYA